MELFKHRNFLPNWIASFMRYLVVAIFILLGDACSAGVITTLEGRWDAAPRTIAGNERSLNDGLRFSVSGGSYQAFRDQFQWTSLPTIGAFQQVVERAFSAWTVTDPISGFGTSLRFVPDFGTSVVSGAGFGTLNINGAEIDLIASNAGSAALAGQTSVSLTGTPVTLTSGIPNYSPSVTIQGVDLHMNSGAVYSLDAFRRILTHEIGHAIGLGDADLGGNFIDDNYNIASPLATLTNSWAALVNPLDPANSIGLSQFALAASSLTTPGVDLLMESNGLGVSAGNPLSNLVPLTNDEFGTRQYLYPSISAVPEPGVMMFTGGVFLGLLVSRYVHRKCNSNKIIIIG